MKYLYIGAHPDDIEISCAGTIMKQLKEGNNVHVVICTDGKGRPGDRVLEQCEVWERLGITGEFLGFDDGNLIFSKDLVTSLDDVIRRFDPDTVFTHSQEDSHQDHQALSKAVTSANRHKRFNLFYFQPADVTVNFKANYFVDIDEVFVDKCELLKIFDSQQDRWYVKIHEVGFGTSFARHVEKFRLEFYKI